MEKMKRTSLAVAGCPFLINFMAIHDYRDKSRFREKVHENGLINIYYII